MKAPWVIEECVEGLAGVAALYADDGGAAVLFGAAEAERQILGHVRSSFDQAVFDRRVASVRARLRDRPFQAEWEKGRR